MSATTSSSSDNTKKRRVNKALSPEELERDAKRLLCSLESTSFTSEPWLAQPPQRLQSVASALDETAAHLVRRATALRATASAATGFAVAATAFNLLAAEIVIEIYKRLGSRADRHSLRGVNRHLRTIYMEHEQIREHIYNLDKEGRLAAWCGGISALYPRRDEEAPAWKNVSRVTFRVKVLSPKSAADKRVWQAFKAIVARLHELYNKETLKRLCLDLRSMVPYDRLHIPRGVILELRSSPLCCADLVKVDEIVDFSELYGLILPESFKVNDNNGRQRALINCLCSEETRYVSLAYNFRHLDILDISGTLTSYEQNASSAAASSSSSNIDTFEYDPLGYWGENFCTGMGIILSRTKTLVLHHKGWDRNYLRNIIVFIRHINAPSLEVCIKWSNNAACNFPSTEMVNTDVTTNEIRHFMSRIKYAMCLRLDDRYLFYKVLLGLCFAYPELVTYIRTSKSLLDKPIAYKFPCIHVCAGAPPLGYAFTAKIRASKTAASPTTIINFSGSESIKDVLFRLVPGLSAAYNDSAVEAIESTVAYELKK